MAIGVKTLASMSQKTHPMLKVLEACVLWSNYISLKIDLKGLKIKKNLTPIGLYACPLMTSYKLLLITIDSTK
jgi:hypothetical protein